MELTMQLLALAAPDQLTQILVYALGIVFALIMVGLTLKVGSCLLRLLCGLIFLAVIVGLFLFFLKFGVGTFGALLG